MTRITQAPGLQPARSALVRARVGVAFVLDGGRREFVAVAVLTALLVLLRAAPFTFWEETYFSSDEAIIGLMAKHLSELKTFPLFFYGQNYMLAVQAWFIAPFFLIARPSVAALRFPLLALNVVAALVLIRTLHRETGVRPGMVFVALLPFILPPPYVAADLLDGNGCGAGELFLYVAALWVLRKRPFGFGILLAVAYLHREFVMAAVPALLVVGLLDRAVWRVATIKGILRAVLGFAAAWIVIDDLRMHFYGASLVLQAQQLTGGHLCFRLSEMPARIWYVISDCFPYLLGARRLLLSDAGIGISARAGVGPLAWIPIASLGVMLARWGWNWSRGDRRSAYPVYLLAAGVAVLGAYPLACNLDVKLNPLVRYLHLALLVPSAVFVGFMQRETAPAWRRAAVAVFLVAGSVNLADNVSALHAAYSRPMPAYHRRLADLLVRNHIRYARAGYWDAYITDFLTREKVTVASTGKVRIPAYLAAVEAHPEAAAWISRFPCEGGIQEFPWCIVPPQQPGNR